MFSLCHAGCQIESAITSVRAVVDVQLAPLKPEYVAEDARRPQGERTMQPRTAHGAVLVSWLARNNDPFERDRSRNVLVRNGAQVAGPTLTLLFDAESPYRERID